MRRWLARPRSLSYRLTLLVLAIGAQVLLVIGLSYADQLAERRRLELEGLTRSARNSASVLEGFLRSLDSTTFAGAGLLARSPDAFDQATYGPYLASITQHYRELRALFITDRDGKVVVSASGEGIGIDLSSRPYMQVLKTDVDRVWSGSIAGLQSGDITVAFGRPVRTSAGSVRGYLITAFYPERLIQTLKIDLPPDAQLVLIDERGRLLYATDRTEPARTEIDLTDAPGVRDALGGGVVTIDGTETPFQGGARYGALVPIPRTGWVLGVTRPLAALEAEAFSRLAANAAAVIASILFAAAVAAYLANRLARPLRELSTSAAAIARGERPVIPTFNGTVEVEQLSETMRTMQTAIASREDDLRQQQLRLRESDARLRATVEVALDAVVTMDEAGRIIEWNPGAQATFGWSRDEVLGRTMVETIIPVRYRPLHLEGLRRFLQTGSGKVLNRRIEIEALHRDGHEFPVELAISPIRLDRKFLFTGFIRDITSRRRIDEVQTAALVEVQEALRLRDEFLAAAAHDLRTPMTTIKGHLQLIRRRLGEPVSDPIATSLAQLDRGTAKMIDLINELLDIARIRTGQPPSLDLREVDLVALTQNVADAFAGQAPRHEVTIRAVVPRLVGIWDPVRLERMLTNLVSNAIKYSPDGGQVTLTATEESDRGVRWAVVSVSDQGMGIPEADLPRLFTRFFRASNVEGIEGTGIGLEATRRIVELHRGTIQVSSREAAGSTFTVRLPMAAGR